MRAAERSPVRTWDLALLRLAQHHFHIELLLAAEDVHGYGVAGAMIVHHPRQVLHVFHALSVDANDQIAANQDRSIAQ